MSSIDFWGPQWLVVLTAPWFIGAHGSDMTHSCVGGAAAAWSRGNTVLHVLHLVACNGLLHVLLLVACNTVTGKHGSCHDIHETWLYRDIPAIWLIHVCVQQRWHGSHASLCCMCCILFDTTLSRQPSDVILFAPLVKHCVSWVASCLMQQCQCHGKLALSYYSHHLRSFFLHYCNHIGGTAHLFMCHWKVRVWVQRFVACHGAESLHGQVSFAKELCTSTRALL